MQHNATWFNNPSPNTETCPTTPVRHQPNTKYAMQHIAQHAPNLFSDPHQNNPLPKILGHMSHHTCVRHQTNIATHTNFTNENPAMPPSTNTNRIQHTTLFPKTHMKLLLTNNVKKTQGQHPILCSTGESPLNQKEPNFAPLSWPRCETLVQMQKIVAQQTEER